jgi:hypothetical protein
VLVAVKVTVLVPLEHHVKPSLLRCTCTIEEYGAGQVDASLKVPVWVPDGGVIQKKPDPFVIFANALKGTLHAVPCPKVTGALCVPAQAAPATKPPMMAVATPSALIQDFEFLFHVVFIIFQCLSFSDLPIRPEPGRRAILRARLVNL